jgi:catechol 2,3-dioxygenase-like lactoylglutathione lyase family enzyme
MAHTLRLDHLVILVPDLSAAVAQYAAAGFTVWPGGTHADGASHNALVVLADGSYLELIAFLSPAPRHRWGGRHARGEWGLIDFALLPDDTAGVIGAARAAGVAYTGPVAGGRRRPDGQQVDWQMGLPPTEDLPFLCGDVTPRALRVPEGDMREHANGAIGTHGVEVAVSDLAASTRRYVGLLGVAAGANGTGDGSATGTDDAVRWAEWALGGTRLRLSCPAGIGEHGAAAEAARNDLRQHLDRRGEGPWRASLSTSDGSTITLPLG